MKKLLLLASICLIGFYACKKSDSNNLPSNATKITGKWTHVKSVLLKNVNGADSVDEVNNITGTSEFIQFNNDGTGVTSGDGNSLSFKYTLAGDSVLLNADNLSAAFKIKALISNSLVLRQRQYFDGDDAIYYSDDYFTK